MEKRAVIQPGLTPPSEEASQNSLTTTASKAEKAAYSKQLEDHPTKTLADAVEQKLTKI